MATVMNGVSWVEDSLLLAAENVFQAQVRRDWPESRLSFSRWDGKSLIVARNKLLQDSICLIHVGCAGETELDHKSLLQGLKCTLNASFGLRRMGVDVGNTEFTYDAPNLREGLRLTKKLLLQSSVVLFGRTEDSVAIRIDGHGDAVFYDQLQQHLTVPLEVLRRPEAGGKKAAGSVVDGSMQA